jgi:hypothetical protein
VHIVTVAKGGTDVSGSAGTPGDHDNDSAYDSTFATCHDDAAKNWRPACGADPGRGMARQSVGVLKPGCRIQDVANSMDLLVDAVFASAL